MDRLVCRARRAHAVRGFSLVELLVSIAIIGVLVTIAFTFVLPVRTKARDVKRKSDLAQIGRFLALSCYQPQAGPGDYDLAVVAAELVAANPRYASYLTRVPRDPAKGSDAESFYHYRFASGGKCVLYANLENADEPVTLPQLAEPTPGGGQGVLEAAAPGWNGTRKYFQFSN